MANNAYSLLFRRDMPPQNKFMDPQQWTPPVEATFMTRHPHNTVYIHICFHRSPHKKNELSVTKNRIGLEL